MKTLINRIILTSLITAGSFNSYGQDTIKTANGYEVLFDDWQILKYNEKNQLIMKFLKGGEDIKHTHFYEYNNRGQRIKDEWFMAYKDEKAEKEMTSLYFYNSNGKATKEIRIDKRGQRVVIEYNP